LNDVFVVGSVGRDFVLKVEPPVYGRVHPFGADGEPGPRWCHLSGHSFRPIIN
jgi:hypothetical protein